MNYWLLCIPLITAFTGWFVLWLAWKIVFHPLQPRHILGMKIQGVFPAKQEQLAEQIGRIVSSQFSFDSIEQKISDPGSFEKVMPVIETHIDDFLRNKLKEQMPMIGMFIGDKTIGSLKTVFLKEIGLMFPEVMKQFAGSMKKEFDVEQLVVTKIKNLSPATLDKIVSKGLAKEFRMLGLAGAGIGLLLGLIQVVILILIN